MQGTRACSLKKFPDADVAKDFAPGFQHHTCPIRTRAPYDSTIRGNMPKSMCTDRGTPKQFDKQHVRWLLFRCSRRKGGRRVSPYSKNRKTSTVRPRTEVWPSDMMKSQACGTVTMYDHKVPTVEVHPQLATICLASFCFEPPTKLHARNSSCISG